MKHFNDTDPYTILMDVYPKPSHTSFRPSIRPWLSERVVALGKYIPDESFDHDKFNFNIHSKSPVLFYNFYDYVTGSIDRNKKTIVFEAHWDINNDRETLNIVDNTSSCCILLALANSLRGKDLNVNVVMAYCDTEELADVSMAGSRKLAMRIREGDFGNPETVETVVLEVSSHGRILFCDKSDGIFRDDDRFMSVFTPFSDAYVLNHFGVRASCIGIVTRDDAENLMAGSRGCDTWSACHTKADNLSMLDASDVLWFKDWLQSWVISL